MAVLTRRMISVVLLFAVLGISCYGQQLHVKHAPSYVVLQHQSPDSPLSSSELHSVLGGPLGLHDKETPVIQSKSVLRRPKANVLITIVTHKDQDLPVESLASFTLNWDVPFVDVDQLMNDVQGKFLDKDPVMLDLMSTNQFFDIKTSSAMFQSLPSSFASAKERLLDVDSFLHRLAPQLGQTSLNYSITADGGLLAELQMMDDVISTLKKNSHQLDTKTPDIFSFTLTGLKDIGKEYGVHSDQARDAQDIVTKHLNQITEELKSLYKGNVMIEVLTVPSVDRSLVRKTRSLMQSEPSSQAVDFKHLNLEIDYYKDFPASFNIVLWLMIILMITVYVVAYGIWHLNPNLESILYRVPQEDLKKTN